MINFKAKVDFRSNEYKERAEKAYEKLRPILKLQIAKDCNVNAPLGDSAHLRNSALRSAAVKDKYVRWDEPYAHFQHEGRVMIGKHSHSPWAKKYEKKIYTGRLLTYRQGGSKWIDKTMQERMSVWIRGAQALFKKYYGG